MTETGLDEDNKMIEEHKKQIQEVCEGFQKRGESQFIEFSPEKIQGLFESDQIPKDLTEWFFNNQKEQLKKKQEMEEFVKNNPDMPKDEMMNHLFKQGALSQEEILKNYENAAYSGRFLEFLLDNSHLIVGDNTETNRLPLFKGIDSNESFGIARFMSDSIYYLKTLLKKMELTNIHAMGYEAIGETLNSKKEKIQLSYNFQASSEEEANKILKEYKETMASKGLKIWMAHWLMANEAGRVEYTCPMIEIMKRIADEDRESFFSVKEKEEHWAITRMLSGSKLGRKREVKKKGAKIPVEQWLEQPLLEILGGEKELETNDKYPNLIAVRVLGLMDKSGFVASIYRNSTTRLSPSDTLLAYKIQTRATQQGYGTKSLRFDWDLLFEAGNLQSTAATKKTVAKAQVRKKLDRLQKSEIIEGWDEGIFGMDINPTKQKKRGKPSLKKETT